MRFISLSGITAAAALAGLALMGSLAGAASVPTPGRLATAEDLATLKTYLGDYFQFQPQPAIVKPEGLVCAYHRGKGGFVDTMTFHTPEGEDIRRMTAMATTKSGQPSRIEMVDLYNESPIYGITGTLYLGYGESSENVLSYKLGTRNGIVLAEVQKGADGTNDLEVTLHPAGKKFTLKNVPLWDGNAV
ncbi:hypothetical protein THASP1DRAFT_26497 [Thamnocephalis sphaerospora]|uniref:Lipocalin-like domain-containing protein n=1 Tax=Thamnocephalis sphaerospora TaxID=78915 RepID=A0A4V1IVR1_9FUNG|nr:hypothetical protein THASP1DRAFT_26497 [Thamnocephalis sphaerospora]|eukprot:RKP04939.1 hypothetical protein THASP1DRAFT_26497 [Thamnocephalis sphaerospora]